MFVGQPRPHDPLRRRVVRPGRNSSSEIINGRLGGQAGRVPEREEDVGLEPGVVHGHGEGVDLESGRVAFLECTGEVGMNVDGASGLDGGGIDEDGADAGGFGAGGCAGGD